MKKTIFLVLVCSLNSLASISYWELSEQPYQCTNGKSYDLLTRVVSYYGDHGSWSVSKFCEKGVLNRVDGMFEEDGEEISNCANDTSLETTFCFNEFKKLNPKRDGHINSPLTIVHGNKLVSFCKVDLTDEYWETKTRNDPPYDYYYLNYYIHKSTSSYYIDTKLIAKDGALERVYNIFNKKVKAKYKGKSIHFKRKESLLVSIDKNANNSTEIYAETDDRIKINNESYTSTIKTIIENENILNLNRSMLSRLNHLQGSCLVYE